MAAEDVEQASILEGILPSGGMSLLAAKPKVGKTTLAFNLAVAVSRGSDFLGRKTEKGTVVYLALEEKRGEIKKKLTAAGISHEPITFHFGSAPADAMAQVEPLIIETKAKLLIIDVLQKFCRLGIDLGEDGTLRAVGTRQAVDIAETKPLILDALKGGESLTITDLYERVEKNKNWVSNAVAVLVENKEILRSGSGKKNDAYKYAQKDSSFPPSDTKEEIKTTDKPLESQKKCLLDDFSDSPPKDETAKEEFSIPKTNEKQVEKQALNRFDEHGFDWVHGEQKDEPDDDPSWSERPR